MCIDVVRYDGLHICSELVLSCIVLRRYLIMTVRCYITYVLISRGLGYCIRLRVSAICVWQIEGVE